MAQVHIIANREIGMTECERLVEWHVATDPTPWPLADNSGEQAIWDGDEQSHDDHLCRACWEAYIAEPTVPVVQF